MLKLSLAVAGFCCAASSLFATMTPWTPDTVLEAGALSIPVTADSTVDSIDSHEVVESFFRDSTGKTIAYKHRKSNQPHSSTVRLRGLLFASDGSIARVFTELRHFGSSGYNQVKDTLVATQWTDAGEVSEGLLKSFHASSNKFGSMHYAYGSTINVSLDPDSLSFVKDSYIDSTVKIDTGWTADTLVEAGAKSIYCKDVDGGGNYGSSFSNSRSLIDMYGRPIFHAHSSGNGAHGNGEGFTMNLELNEVGDVARQCQTKYRYAPQSKGGVADTLTGTAWNELGMITEGVLRRHRYSHNPGGSTLSTKEAEVLFFYDSTSLTVNDTIFMSNFIDVDMPTGVVSTAVAKVGALRIVGKSLSLPQALRGEQLSLYTLKGALVEQRRVQATTLDLSHLPAGCYILKSAATVMRFSL